MVNIDEFITGAQNITSESELITYVSKELFLGPIIAIYLLVMIIMLVLGMTIINRDKANFYAIFIFSLLVLGILLFFTFYYPIIPQFTEKIFGGLI